MSLVKQPLRLLLAAYLALTLMGTFTRSTRESLDRGEPEAGGPLGSFTAIDFSAGSQAAISKSGKYSFSRRHSGFPRTIPFPGTQPLGIVLFRSSAGIGGNARRPGIKSAIPLKLRI